MKESFTEKNLNENPLLMLQSCAKYIGKLLDFTENLDFKYKFNAAFWLYSSR